MPMTPASLAASPSPPHTPTVPRARGQWTWLHPCLSRHGIEGRRRENNADAQPRRPRCGLHVLIVDLDPQMSAVRDLTQYDQMGVDYLDLGRGDPRLLVAQHLERAAVPPTCLQRERIAPTA